jgi:hypothetical protein
MSSCLGDELGYESQSAHRRLLFLRRAVEEPFFFKVFPFPFALLFVAADFLDRRDGAFFLLEELLLFLLVFLGALDVFLV